jgi:Phage integrase family
VTGTVDTKKRHKAEPVPLDQSEAYAIIENLPEFAERARPDKPRFRVRDVVALWWETALRPVTIGRLRCPDHFRPGATDLTITRDIDKVRYKRQLPLTELAVQALERSCPDIGLIFGVHDLRPQLLKAARRAHEAGKLPAWKIERVSPYDFRHGRTTQLANRTKHLAGVSFLVGHKDPSTTAKYVHAVREHAEEALRAVSSGLADQKTADEVPPQAALPVAVGQELLMDTCGPPSPGDEADRAKSAVRKGGLEPPRELPHWNLNPARLPIPPLSLACLREFPEIPPGEVRTYYLTVVAVGKGIRCSSGSAERTPSGSAPPVRARRSGTPGSRRHCIGRCRTPRRPRSAASGRRGSSPPRGSRGCSRRRSRAGR